MSWNKESKRHSLAARGIKTSVNNRTTYYPRTHRRLEGSDFFFKGEEIYIYEPYNYLEDRYGVPWEVSKELFMYWEEDSEGIQGANKELLDSFGRRYEERNSNTI